MPGASQRISQLLEEWSPDNAPAREEFAALVYEELRHLARRYMRRERPDHTLQTTALVHEAYLRLVDQRIAWQSRSQFLGVAATMMRRILVDHAKAHSASKRGADRPKVSLDEALHVSEQPAVHLLAVNDALTKFESVDPENARIVELRFFGGLSNEEIGQMVDLSPATVQRRWAAARAWLAHELGH